MAGEVQSLLFERRRWTERCAEHWIWRHGYSAGQREHTDRYWRFRQFDPIPGARIRTVPFGRNTGIKALISWPGQEAIEAAEDVADAIEALE